MKFTYNLKNISAKATTVDQMKIIKFERIATKPLLLIRQIIVSVRLCVPSFHSSRPCWWPNTISTLCWWTVRIHDVNIRFFFVAFFLSFSMEMVRSGKFSSIWIRIKNNKNYEYEVLKRGKRFRKMHLVILVETRPMRGILALFDLFIFVRLKSDDLK